MLMLVSVFKALTASRLGKLEPVSHIVWFARLLIKAIIVGYGDYGLGLPGVTWRLLRDYPNWAVFALGGMLSLIIFGYLYWAANQSKADGTERSGMLKFIVLGLVVFESSWDLAGALMIFYRDRTLRADVVTPNLKVEEDRLSTVLYGGMYSHYPYNEKLFVYNFGRKTTHQLTDAQTARRYFQTFNPDHSSGCPRSREGLGVPVF